MLIYALIAARKCRGNSAPRKGSFFMHFFVKTEFFRAKTTVYGTKSTVYGRWVEKRFPLFYNHCTEG